MSDRTTSSAKHHPERANASLKLLDQAVGIPLIFILGLFRKRRRSVPSPVKRAAILHTAAIGDTVLSSALVQDIRRTCPDSRIIFFSGGSNYEIAALIPGVDEIIRLSIKQPIQSILTIRRAGFFDLWIDCGPWPRLNALFSYFAHAAVTIGFRTRGQHRHFGYDLAVDHSSSRHEIENYRGLLQAAGIKGESLPALTIKAIRGGDRTIIVHMFPGGSRSYLKTWPEENWRELIDQFTDQGFTVLLTGSKENRGQAESFRETLQRPEQIQVLAGSISLRETAHRLSRARLVVSVDTGIMHMASAIGCNLISLHGPTSPERWGPLSANAVPVSTMRPCSPCISLGFESSCKDPQCMIQLGVPEVYGAARAFLDQ